MAVEPGWEQRDDESWQAYRAFGYYLNLPHDNRTRDRAYQQYQRDKGTSEARIKKRAPGKWTEWSNQYEWSKRANEKTRHDLARERNERQRQTWLQHKEDLKGLVTKYVGTLKKAYEVGDKIIDNLHLDSDPSPRAFRQATMGLQTVSEMLEQALGIHDAEYEQYLANGETEENELDNASP